MRRLSLTHNLFLLLCQAAMLLLLLLFALVAVVVAWLFICELHLLFWLFDYLLRILSYSVFRIPHSEFHFLPLFFLHAYFKVFCLAN